MLAIQELLTRKVCNFIKKETLVQVFSCKICEIFKNNFFTEHLRWLLLMLGLIAVINTLKLLFEKSIAYFLFCRSTVMQIIKQFIHYFDVKSKPFKVSCPIYLKISFRLSVRILYSLFTNKQPLYVIIWFSKRYRIFEMKFLHLLRIH